MTTATSDLVIVGAGMAATRLLETLRARGDRRRITVFGEEGSLPYNRILLSPLLAGEHNWTQLQPHDAEWYRRNHIDLRTGQRVVAVDCHARVLRCDDGSQWHYRQLVLATGSRAALPPLEGIRLPGVSAFRNREDVERLRRAAQRGGSSVVLGGGLLGIEAAVALAAQGMSVTLVQRGTVLMNRQLDATASSWLRAALEQRGVTVISGVAPQALEGEGAVEAVNLADGRRLPAQLVVAATGIEPVTEPAVLAGLDVNRGIVVDTRMRTSVDAVYALGECCELNGETVGLVAPIWQQVETLAANLCGESREFRAEPYVTMLKVSGVDVHVMGEVHGDGLHCLCYEDRERGIYRKLTMRDGQLVGALLFGDVTGSQHYLDMLRRGTRLEREHCRLLLAGESVEAEPLLASA